jgi:hypothetical protein
LGLYDAARHDAIVQQDTGQVVEHGRSTMSTRDASGRQEAGSEEEVHKYIPFDPVPNGATMVP